MVIIFILIGILFFIIGVVLYLGKIPPNGWFGFRTPTTMANKDLWYKANRYSGRDMMIYGIYFILVNIIVNYLPLEFPLSMIVWFAAIMVGMYVVVIRGILYTNRFH